MSTPCLPGAGPSLTDRGPGDPTSPLVTTLHVQVTHTEIRNLSADELITLCWLRRLAFANGDAVKTTREDLRLKIGWTAKPYRPRAGEGRVSKATTLLATRGLIQVHSRHDRGLQRTLNAYTVTPRAEGRFEKVPYWLLDQLSAPELEGRGTLLLKHWLTWRMLCGARGECRATVGEVAKETGSGSRTTSHARRLLVQLGLLRSLEVSGYAWVTSMVGVVDLPKRPTPQTVTTTSLAHGGAGEQTERPLSEILQHPRQDDCTTPAPNPAHNEEYTSSKTAQDPGIGPQGRISNPSRETATATSSPNQDDPSHEHHSGLTAAQKARRSGKNTDRHAQAAQCILHDLATHHPWLRDPHHAAVRGMIINTIAKRSRLRSEAGQPIDFKALSRHAVDLFDETADDQVLLGRECVWLREAIRRERADSLAAPESVGRGTLLTPSAVPSQPVPVSLEDLAAAAHERHPRCAEDVPAWAAWWMARLVLQAIEKGLDPVATLHGRIYPQLGSVLRHHLSYSPATEIRDEWLAAANAAHLRVLRSIESDPRLQLVPAA